LRSAHLKLPLPDNLYTIVAKKEFMIAISFFYMPFKSILQFAIICPMLLHPDCSKLPQPNHFDFQSTAPDIGSASACIEVHGKVLGDIIPASKVFLYESCNLKYSTAMSTIRKCRPSRWASVNISKGFKFDCLSFGKYVFVIPAMSYNGSIGSPLPYEFDCPNVSIKIAFQGGDMHYAVGAFSIEKPQNRSDSDCNENPFLCRTTRGGLYRDCPLDLK
jgi:hypothetical protein